MRLWKITVVGLIFAILCLVWIFVIGISFEKPGYHYNEGHNAVWIGHEWVGEDKSEQEIQQLVLKLKDHEIDTVFVHVGPINVDGTIDPETYKYSIDFIDIAKKFNKDIQYQAWLGQLRGKIDLSDTEVRNNIAKQCIALAQYVEFDGIHFDIEPVWDGDTDFIVLLKEVRELLPEEEKISVALAEYIPGSFVWFTDKIMDLENFNSEVNYKNVAKYADQVVVMVYDTGINNEWLYRWVVQEQTIRVTALLPDNEVFIAIPSYDEEKAGFNPQVENMKNGMQGIVDGMNNFRSNEDSFAGAAIYSFWETDDEEWAQYKNIWQNDKS